MEYSYYSDCNDYPDGSQPCRVEITQYYSLWNSSQYYNTNELSPRNYFRDFMRAQITDAPTVNREEVKVEEERDAHNRRTVTRLMLTEEPDMKKGSDQDITTIETIEIGDTDTDSPDYTAHFRQRAGRTVGRGDGRLKKSKQNKFEKKLLDTLSQPVKLSKAESMMQKMGWEGGALGKAGNGIVEPIAPNMAYATKTVGFGQMADAIEQHKSPKRQQRQKKGQRNQKIIKEDFLLNTLFHILEFVKNDTEVQLLFDRKLSPRERKMIHHCVNCFINGNMEDRMNLEITMAAQQDLLDKIKAHNHFELCTESFGEKSQRQLCLFKLAPDNVYLVIPSDLAIDEDYATDNEIANESVDIIEDEKYEIDQKEEENPFLKSITRNLTKERMTDKIDKEKADGKVEKQVNGKVDKLDIHKQMDGKLVKYFHEFAMHDDFHNLRFLGPFGQDERSAIRRLLFDVQISVNNDNANLRCELFESAFKCEHSYEVVTDNNGSEFVNKIKKCLQT